MRAHRLIALTCVLLLCATLAGAQATKPAPARPAAAAPMNNLIQMPSTSPLYEIQIMVLAGSANDPQGKEGTANLTGRLLVDGGFGDPKNPTTKEKLAEITRPWGDGAIPRVGTQKQTSTISMTVPRDVFPTFVAQILKPMFSSPLWQEKELDRIRGEVLNNLQSSLRFEQQEALGLEAMDNWIFEGTPLQTLPAGTVKGVKAVTRDDLAKFFTTNYTLGNMYVATTITDPAHLKLLTSVLPPGAKVKQAAAVTPAPVNGRSVLIIGQPNAIATSVHFGYPIPVKRGHPDYWPLYIANAFLGQHRDSFGRLYQDIREERGYNYGDYSYIEYLAARPFALFPPPTTPRTAQYFNLWIRPIQHSYVHFLMKAATAEVDRLVAEGIPANEIELAKVKVKTLYLNFAESTGRQLGYRLDDAFYGMNRGYLDQMLKDIDAVTTEQVNAALKKYFQTANLKYVIVTNMAQAEQLANDIANGTNITPKTPAEYHISEPVPPEKQKMLAQDEEWKKYPLNIPRDRIYILKAEQMFETAEIPGVTKAVPNAPGGTK